MSQQKIDQYFKVSTINRNKDSTLRTITKKQTVISKNNQSGENNIPWNVTDSMQNADQAKKGCSGTCLASQKIFSPMTPLRSKGESSHQERTPNKLTYQGAKGRENPLKRKYSPVKRSNIVSNYSAPRKINMEQVDTLKLAIENLNFTREGAIPLNKFNLNEIYSKNSFCFQYNQINLTSDARYEVNDVVMPIEFDAMHLHNVIINTFANPINCGYFIREELDLVFSILTLSRGAQTLFARMIKRKKGWHRIDSIHYPDISTNLVATFQELESCGICTMDVKSEEINVLIKLLQVDEIRKLCKELKVNWRGKKDDMINNLLNLCKDSRTLFPGIKAPREAVCGKIHNALGLCAALQSKAIDIINRVITLWFPCQDPQESISDVFFLLMRVQKQEVVFPDIPLELFPIFNDMDHLLRYIEGKNVFSEVLSSIEKKDWNTVRNFGNSAFNILPSLLYEETKEYLNSNVPLHVKNFAPGYIWCKVLSKCIDAFKKTHETIERAVEMLKFLIQQKCHMQHRKGEWYAELALIEMHHKKNLHVSANVILEALHYELLTEVDKINLLERVRKLSERKTGISKDVKAVLKDVAKDFSDTIPSSRALVYTTIEATLMQGNKSGSKTVWHIQTNGDNVSYGSVEELALYHYMKKGFSHGIHCEGALPVMFFCLLFWEELYNISIPGAFVSSLQSAPLDLYTGDFYQNRKGQIDLKLAQIHSWPLDNFADSIESRYYLYQGYESIMHSNLFKEQQQHFKELIQCLSINSILKICQKLLMDFKLWRSGFPDLILWNPSTKCKIVEVKGPNDVLSTKQMLWLQYLNEIGLDVEVCLVNEKGGTRIRKERKADC